ncbi:NAD(P)/FAD-dependent oxidoreductase [Arthrobacter agilis]|uniref:phytoene desaturase family protein n=1 Tax=Arthrobacter agilis TaxID=37921 RepID=UPI000B34E96E|nr:NAD(P)/FAD-dependent oxidoreductase [Arthrobacter agilis]OUM42283.1 dehydrogenase [Arthrobacter agilis]PPB45625.1 NAD(P)/FAD-dependent oxidoreductase [Arthrobacter agilis]TPV26394.1 NAD(P)/FAD-dependent oxidoreductase [Arthrobacter agilis]VDR33713.1 Protoporphyrinogen oxidase [Arthrobacter agilis]
MVDVEVVGSGPNGLAAAVVMARAGLSVRVHETAATIGGGSRSVELMEQDHLHDFCSAVHPMALASPFFRAFELSRRIGFAVPDVSFAHPLDGGRAGVAYRSMERTVAGLGVDGEAYRRLVQPLSDREQAILGVALHHVVRIPKHPVAALRFAGAVLDQGLPAWNRRFRTDEAKALVTGVMAHPVGTLPSLTGAGAGLVLNLLAHTVGWPIPVGGSQAIADVLALDVRDHGGEIVTGSRIESLAEVSDARVVLLDVAPKNFQAMARGRLTAAYEAALAAFTYGNAACKVDFILSGPVPWTHPELHRAGTAHLGGTREEIAAGEKEVNQGRHPASPYVLLSQPSSFDPTRAPEGRHTLWTYCHVPRGSTRDMAEAITAQIERFAPGFRDVVVRSHTTTASGLEAYNANYVGGDFSSGAVNLRQILARPVPSLQPWATPLKGVYLCSQSTPPGPGVHGMAGLNAAGLALRREFGLPVPYLGLEGMPPREPLLPLT